MKEHILVFINGDPRSGKDTVSDMMVEEFGKLGMFSAAFSSIEPVREMLTISGFDLSQKTEADRLLLSEVGDAVERHSDFRSKACVSEFEAAVATGRSVALILHTREPATIHKIAFGLRRHSVLFTTLFIHGRGRSITSNPSDAGVRGMRYDREIWNGGTLADLRRECSGVVQALAAEASL